MKRRTLEEKKRVLELKEIVINKIIKYNIKPHKISSNVPNISHPTIMNIINGKTEYPSMSKLESVNNFIVNNYESPDNLKHNIPFSQDEKLDVIINLLGTHSVQLEIIFEILSSETSSKNFAKLMKNSKDSVHTK